MPPDALAKRFKVVKVKRRDPAAPFIRRLQGKREQVLRFMTDCGVPFDNNGSERDIRMVKLQGRGVRPPSNAGDSQSSQAKL